jgi:hypothetical protein
MNFVGARHRRARPQLESHPVWQNPAQGSDETLRNGNIATQNHSVQRADSPVNRNRPLLFFFVSMDSKAS